MFAMSETQRAMPQSGYGVAADLINEAVFDQAVFRSG